jgi:hypothetical protein
MQFRSHSPAQVADAIAEGEQAWMLDTGTDGDDDVLVGSLEEVTSDLLEHFELDALPEGWELTRIEADWLD